MSNATTSADGQVELRTPRRVRLLTIAGCLLPFVVVSGALRSGATLVGALVGFSLAYALLFRHRRVVLTPAGLEVWRLGRTVIPWGEVTSVEVVGWAWNARTVRVTTTRRVHRLPAPASGFGVGNREVEDAAALIDQWRQQHEAATVR